MPRVLIAVDLPDNERQPEIGEAFFVTSQQHQHHLEGTVGYVVAPDEPTSPLPDPPENLADAWRRYQVGEPVEPWEVRKLDEWRVDCARDAGF